MSNKICIIYTATNGLHTTYGKVTKKNLYGIARLIKLNYSIGYYDKELNYIEEKNVSKIIKPESITYNKEAQKFHNISYEIAEKQGLNSKEVLKEFKEDLKKVKIIISHSLEFHLKAIQAEAFRSYETINFSKYILIDTMSFNHEYSYPKLVDLESNLKLSKSTDQIKSISNVFSKLYFQYNENNQS